MASKTRGASDPPRLEGRARNDEAEFAVGRRAAILDVATDLFGRNGYHETTIKDIAAAAGISSGLVYSYVQNKDDLLFQIIARSLEGYCTEMTRAMAGVRDPVNRFKVAYRTYCLGVLNNTHQTLLAFRHVVSLPKDVRDRIKALDAKSIVTLEAEIRACIDAGHFREVDPFTAGAMAAHLAQAWPLKKWLLSTHTSATEFVELALDMVLGSLSAHKVGPAGPAAATRGRARARRP
ncbi:MAG: TetR/AcrR family transcriptional regulator [Rubrivivax sp.]|nr:TetR/AcrR family transcriptional regulator [Rubrivivax sp.]